MAEELEAEVSDLLDRWRRRYSGRPEQERRQLLLLALEREQIVAVAYREDVLARRIDWLPVDHDTRRLLRQCLVWIWKDEELHATYMRGLLLATRRPLPTVIVYGRQIVGALSGWVTSTSQHGGEGGRVRAGGLAASALVTTARLTGRISAALSQELHYRSFRRYCQLNVALERTAELAYQRLVELAADAAEGDMFERIRVDEARHGDAFRAIADALDDRDHLVASSGRDLVDRLAGISPWFLPGSLRPSSHPHRAGFGTAAPVFVEEGRDGALSSTLRRALDNAGIGSLVRERGEGVAIRTSFMLGYDRRDRSNLVDPAVIDELAAYLRDNGAGDVAVIEAPTVYGRYFEHRSVAEVADYFGFTSPRYRIVDADADQREFPYERGLLQSTINKTWWDADVRIVVPKLRTDPNEFGHLCLSTLEGMASQIGATVYTGRQLDFRTATMMLLDVAPPDAAVMDAWGPIADGPLGVMGCRRPATAWRIYAGRDALSVDRAVLADMGLADARRAPIVRRALHWFGLEFGPLEVRGTSGRLSGGFRDPWSRWRWRALSRISYPIYANLSGEGQVFVPALDQTAFPPIGRVSPALRAVRRVSQLAFGTRPGRP